MKPWSWVKSFNGEVVFGIWIRLRMGCWIVVGGDGVKMINGRLSGFGLWMGSVMF